MLSNVIKLFLSSALFDEFYESDFIVVGFPFILVFDFIVSVWYFYKFIMRTFYVTGNYFKGRLNEGDIQGKTEEEKLETYEEKFSKQMSELNRNCQDEPKIFLSSSGFHKCSLTIPLVCLANPPKYFTILSKSLPLKLYILLHKFIY